jgi:hypothetical protein
VCFVVQTGTNDRRPVAIDPRRSGDIGLEHLGHEALVTEDAALERDGREQLPRPLKANRLVGGVSESFLIEVARRRGEDA